ncbi:hypothetical protein JN01_0534 [Entomoplasma freundtii]|uniref:Uncharacterized protein n=1 Tax=Entomoplasma freundtii TaxID=74700 RepID=A0A2K8NRM9_9MOLU|nr:hypothetical protein [Entomoplasma freundtii]ATZ16424.1 hypothetical protein EFREU_v1c03980 [Entomoplasma freundtii]TDY56537.1 hypothetical protein JN01_0534 [Entomoplasma freundtii]
MKKINKEFEKKNLSLDLKDYLTLTQKKVLISLVVASLTFVVTGVILIYLLTISLNSSNDSLINKITIIQCLLILPCLISFNYSLWLMSLFININKLKNNLSEIHHWSLPKKKKYFRTFILVAKINFSRRNIIAVIQETQTIFQKYILDESNHLFDYSTTNYVFEPVVETATMFFSDFYIFDLIALVFWLIIGFLPKTWIRLKNGIHLNFFKAKANENIQNNFRTISSSFLQTLGIKKESETVSY